ncbi:MAG: lycopene cyclase family protein, partial [Planctomycetota bacterium]
TLMDFSVSQQHGAHFMYVLPFQSDRVLVESTYLTTGISEDIDYESNATAYASDVLGIDPSRVVYRESGVLPMTLRPLGPRSTPRVWSIGTRAGVGRASSGYAFDAIQQDSARLVDALLRGQPRPRPPRSPILSMLDRVLLSLLDTHNAAAPDLFARLFQSADTDKLVRFLGDVPRPLDYLAVMWAMPKAQVIRHVLTNPSAWPRPIG